MIHVRQRIRDFVVDDLKNAELPGVGPNVQGSVFFPFAQDMLPAVCVYPEDEAVQVATMGTLDREVHIIVKIMISGAEGVEDLIDDIAAHVEAKLDRKAGGWAYEGRLFEVRFVRSGDGDAEVMSLEMAYAFQYMTSYTNAETTTH